MVECNIFYAARGALAHQVVLAASETPQHKDVLLREAFLHLIAEKRPVAGMNFDDIDLRGEDLSGQDFSGCSFNNARLSACRFDGAKFSGAHMMRADLSHASLRGAVLNGAILEDAKMQNADLQGADLCGVSLSNADLSGAKIENTRLVGASLDGAHFTQVDLAGNALHGCALQNASIEGLYWNNVPLKNPPVTLAGLECSVQLVDDHLTTGKEVISRERIFSDEDKDGASIGLEVGRRLKPFIAHFMDVQKGVIPRGTR